MQGSASVSSNLTVGGNLTVSGNTTTVNTATLTVEDPLIKLASGNNSGDTVDIGFYGLYDNSGSTDVYTGLTRDASDDKWHLWKLNQAEPTTTVNTGGTGYAVDTFVANLEGIVTAADTSTAVTQSSSDNSTKIATTAYVDAHDGATYDLSIEQTGGNDDDPVIRLAAGGSESGNDDLTITGGTNVTVTRNSGTALTIAATGGNTSFQVEDGDGTEVTIADAKEWKFTEGTGDGASIDINWTDVSHGTDADPFDLEFGVTNTDKGSSQNIFKTIAVSGQSDIDADSNTDTLTFAEGSNVTLTTNASTDTLTVAASNTQNTTTLSWVDSSNDILLRNTTGGAGSGTDDIKIVAGSNVTLTHTDADNFTIAANNTTYSAGHGLDLSSTTFSVDVSDFLSGGTNNEIVTAGGADTLVSESTLTYDGSFFVIQGNAGANTPTITQGLAIGWNDSNGSREVDFIMQSGQDDHTTNTMYFNSYNGSNYKRILKLGGADTEAATYISVYGQLQVAKDKLAIDSTAVTTTAAELNVLDGITSTTTELNKLDGFTGDATDLNYAKELYDTGVTSTEFNTALDGITSSAAELNVLDGVSAGTVAASKAVVVDSNKDIASFRNVTMTGTILAGASGTGNIYVGGQTSNQYLRLHHNNSSSYLDANGAYTYLRATNGSNTRFRFGMSSDAGQFMASGDVVAYGSPSDKRLKENIKPIDSALDKVMKLEGVTFDWKKSDSILELKEDIGFIAQDVQKVVPELVRENENGMLSMRHQGVAPILLEAIKELKAEIEELKKQIK